MRNLLRNLPVVFALLAIAVGAVFFWGRNGPTSKTDWQTFAQENSYLKHFERNLNKVLPQIESSREIAQELDALTQMPTWDLTAIKRLRVMVERERNASSVLSRLDLPASEQPKETPESNAFDRELSLRWIWPALQAHTLATTRLGLGGPIEADAREDLVRLITEWLDSPHSMLCTHALAGLQQSRLLSEPRWMSRASELTKDPRPDVARMAQLKIAQWKMRYEGVPRGEVR